MLAWYLGGHFPLKTCDGRPIAYQMMYSLARSTLYGYTRTLRFTPWKHCIQHSRPLIRHKHLLQNGITTEPFRAAICAPSVSRSTKRIR